VSIGTPCCSGCQEPLTSTRTSFCSNDCRAGWEVRNSLTKCTWVARFTPKPHVDGYSSYGYTFTGPPAIVSAEALAWRRFKADLPSHTNLYELTRLVQQK
jgi:hypothetical protein